MMVPLNKGTATMLVSPDNPLRIELLPSCQRGQVGIWKLSMLMLRVTSAFGLISRRALSRQSVLATCPEVLSLGSPFLHEMGMCIFRSYHMEHHMEEKLIPLCTLHAILTNNHIKQNKLLSDRSHVPIVYVLCFGVALIAQTLFSKLELARCNQHKWILWLKADELNQPNTINNLLFHLY